MAPWGQREVMVFYALWWSFCVELDGTKGRQCFCTPFGGAFAWSLMRFGRCPTVLKGLTLCRRNGPTGPKGGNGFLRPLVELLRGAVRTVSHRPQRVKPLFDAHLSSMGLNRPCMGWSTNRKERRQERRHDGKNLDRQIRFTASKATWLVQSKK